MSARRGEQLWDKPGVPQKAWFKIGDLDLREVYGPAFQPATCEMCGQTGIRFLHTMMHPDYGADMDVGRQCASKMAEPYASNQPEECASEDCVAPAP